MSTLSISSPLRPHFDRGDVVILRQGRKPRDYKVVGRSRCADGTWVYKLRRVGLVPKVRSRVRERELVCAILEARG